MLGLAIFPNEPFPYILGYLVLMATFSRRFNELALSVMNYENR